MGVVVGVVGDVAVFVGGDGLAFHDPFDGGFAVDDVVVGFERDVAEGDVGIVVDDGLVGNAFSAGGVGGFAETHLGDAEMLGGEHVGREFAGVEGDGVGFDAFVVQVEVGELSSGAGKGPEGVGAFDGGDAGQLFAEVVGVAGAVVGRVQQSVDVVEEVFLADRIAGIGFLEVRQARVADAVPAGVAGFGLARLFSAEEVGFFGAVFVFFVEVEGEALASIHCMKIRNPVCYQTRKISTSTSSCNRDYFICNRTIRENIWHLIYTMIQHSIIIQPLFREWSIYG